MINYTLNTENKNIVDAINEVKENTSTNSTSIEEINSTIGNINEILIAINNGNL